VVGLQNPQTWPPHVVVWQTPPSPQFASAVHCCGWNVGLPHPRGGAVM
jgi:hypothetical protein